MTVSSIPAVAPLSEEEIGVNHLVDEGFLQLFLRAVLQQLLAQAYCAETGLANLVQRRLRRSSRCQRRVSSCCSTQV